MNSTLLANTASGGGGAIANFGALTVQNSTLQENSDSYAAGGISNVGQLTVSSGTVISDNVSTLGAADLANFGELTATDGVIVEHSFGAAPGHGGDHRVPPARGRALAACSHRQFREENRP